MRRASGGGGPECTASGVPREAFQPGDLDFPPISAPARAPCPLIAPSGNTPLRRLRTGAGRRGGEESEENPGGNQKPTSVKGRKGPPKRRLRLPDAASAAFPSRSPPAHPPPRIMAQGVVPTSRTINTSSQRQRQALQPGREASPGARGGHTAFSTSTSSPRANRPAPFGPGPPPHRINRRRVGGAYPARAANGTPNSSAANKNGLRPGGARAGAGHGDPLGGARAGGAPLSEVASVVTEASLK